MRPFYEIEADLDNERDIIQALHLPKDITFEKLPISYKLDYAVIKDDKIAAFAEIKARKNTMGAYGTYMIALSKYLTAKEYLNTLGLHTYLIVRWTDVIGKVLLSDFDKSQIRVKLGGRKDRNDWQDIEPVVHIPTLYFEVV